MQSDNEKREIYIRQMLSVLQILVHESNSLEPRQVPRVASVVARSALEEQLRIDFDGLCQKYKASDREYLPRKPSTRSMLTVISALSDADRAGHMKTAWAGLSRGCHQHSYELSPVITEVRGWVGHVQAVARPLSGARNELP